MVITAIAQTVDLSQECTGVSGAVVQLWCIWAKNGSIFFEALFFCIIITHFQRVTLFGHNGDFSCRFSGLLGGDSIIVVDYGICLHYFVAK